MADDPLEQPRPGATADPVAPLRQASRIGSIRAWLNALDLSIYRSIRRMAHDEQRVAAVRRYSALGEHGMIWFAIAGLGWVLDARARERWKRAGLTVVGAYVISTTIKLIIGRKRPVVEDLPHLMQTPTGLSFPSSHATSSFAAARAYSSLLPAGPLYAGAFSMAFTRMYLGVHYPSDIAAGAALGTVLGSFGR